MLNKLNPYPYIVLFWQSGHGGVLRLPTEARAKECAKSFSDQHPEAVVIWGHYLDGVWAKKFDFLMHELGEKLKH